MIVCADVNPPPEHNYVADEVKKPQYEKKVFPSVEDTSERRAVIADFLKLFKKACCKKNNIEAAGMLSVKYWHKKTRRLLL